MNTAAWHCNLARRLKRTARRCSNRSGADWIVKNGGSKKSLLRANNENDSFLKRRCWRTATSVMLCAQKNSFRRRDAAAFIRSGRFEPVKELANQRADVV